MTITPETIAAFRAAVSRAYSRMDLRDFTRALERTYPDIWVEEKFAAFRRLATGLGDTPDAVLVAVLCPESRQDPPTDG